MLLKEVKESILKIVYDSDGHTLSVDDFAKLIPEATEDQLVNYHFNVGLCS